MKPALKRWCFNLSKVCHNSGEIQYQEVTTNPFILIFPQRFECSCTLFQAIIFAVNPQKSTRLSR